MIDVLRRRETLLRKTCKTFKTFKEFVIIYIIYMDFFSSDSRHNLTHKTYGKVCVLTVALHTYVRLAKRHMGDHELALNPSGTLRGRGTTHMAILKKKVCKTP